MSEIDPKLSHLYREAATEGPPSAVDAAILAAARRQAAPRERRARASWLNWMAPASAIATLVVGVSIAFLVDRERPEPSRETRIRPIAKQAQSAPPAGASAAAPAQVPVLATPAAPAAQAFPAESRVKASESKAMLESNVARDSALGAAGASAPPAPAAAGKLAPLRQPAAQRSPQAWLDEIGRLKREGRDQEAAEQLAEFRKAYPAYAVPESLRGLQ